MKLVIELQKLEHFVDQVVQNDSPIIADIDL